MLTVVASLAVMALGYLAYRAIWNPGYALALMWSMYALEQLLQQAHPIFLQRPYLINVTLTLVAIVAVIASFLRGEFKGFDFPTPAYLVLGLFCLASFSVGWSVSPADTWEQLRQQTPYLIAFVVIAPICAVHPTAVSVALKVTLIFGTLVLIGHFFSRVGVRGIIVSGARGTDVEANPLAAANYAATVAMCALFSLYHGRSSNYWKVAKIAIVVLGLILIIRSGSRGQLIAMLASCLLWLPVTAHVALKKSTLVPLLAAGLVCAFGIWAIDHFAISNRWEWESVIAARDGRFRVAWSLFEQYLESGFLIWLLGFGSSSSFRLVGFYPHNVPVEILCELGLLGFLLFLSFLYSTYTRGYRFLKSTANDPFDRADVGLLLAMFSFHSILLLKQGSMVGSVFFFSFGLTSVIAVQVREIRLATKRDLTFANGGVGIGPAQIHSPDAF